jgi:hypothetical protein
VVIRFPVELLAAGYELLALAVGFWLLAFGFQRMSGATKKSISTVPEALAPRKSVLFFASS